MQWRVVQGGQVQASGSEWDWCRLRLVGASGTSAVQCWCRLRLVGASETSAVQCWCRLRLMAASGTSAVQCWCRLRLVGAWQEEGTCCGGGPHSQGCLPCQPGFYPTLAPPHHSTSPAAHFLSEDMRAAQTSSSTFYQSRPWQPGAGWLWLTGNSCKKPAARDPRRGDAGGTGGWGRRDRQTVSCGVASQHRQRRHPTTETAALRSGPGVTNCFNILDYPLPELARLDRSGAAPHRSQSAVHQAGHTNNNLVRPPSAAWQNIFYPLIPPKP